MSCTKTEGAGDLGVASEAVEEQTFVLVNSVSCLGRGAGDLWCFLPVKAGSRPKYFRSVEGVGDLGVAGVVASTTDRERFARPLRGNELLRERGGPMRG